MITHRVCWWKKFYVIHQLPFEHIDHIFVNETIVPIRKKSFFIRVVCILVLWVWVGFFVRKHRESSENNLTSFLTVSQSEKLFSVCYISHRKEYPNIHYMAEKYQKLFLMYYWYILMIFWFNLVSSCGRAWGNSTWGNWTVVLPPCVLSL